MEMVLCSLWCAERTVEHGPSFVFKLDRYCIGHNCSMEHEPLPTFKRPTVNHPAYSISTMVVLNRLLSLI